MNRAFDSIHQPLVKLLTFAALILCLMHQSAFACGPRNLKCVDFDPGMDEWSFSVSDADIVSSPAINANGTIYFGSTDHKLYAINPDGNQMWTHETGDIINSSPTIGADGTIYIGSNDDHLYAINPDGSRKWAYETGGNVISSPAIGTDGTIYVGSADNNLYAINPDGTLKWAFMTRESIILSSPAIASDGTVYIGSLDHFLYAINPDGSVKWSYDTGGELYSSPAIDEGGTIYIGSMDNNLYAINPDGSQKWAYETGGYVASSPAIGTDGTIYVGSDDERLHAINPDGSLNWSFGIGGGTMSSPAIGADGSIFIGSDDGNLYAVSAKGKQLWVFAGEGGIGSSPAISPDGMVYIGSFANWDSSGHLYAIHSSSGGLADSPWPMFQHDARHTGMDGFVGTHEYLWHVDLAANPSTAPSVATDGTVYIGSSDRNLYAFNTDGTYKWAFPTKESIQRPPVIGLDGTIHILDYHALKAINPDGTEKWSIEMDHAFRIPAIGADGTLYIGSNSGELHAINLDGTSRLFFDTESWQGSSSPMINAYGAIHVGSIRLDTINPDGTVRWHQDVDRGVEDWSPNWLPSAIGADGTLYVGYDYSDLYYSYGSPAPEGSYLWMVLNPEGIQNPAFDTSSWSGSPITDADGILYMTDLQGQLNGIDQNGVVISSVDASNKNGTPAIGADGTLYFTTTDGYLEISSRYAEKSIR